MLQLPTFRLDLLFFCHQPVLCGTSVQCNTIVVFLVVVWMVVAWVQSQILILLVRSTAASICWEDPRFSFQRCCVNPPEGDPSCWEGELTFDLCCSRWLSSRFMPPPHIGAEELGRKLRTCMQRPAPMLLALGSGATSPYAAVDGMPLGRLLWCSVEEGNAHRVFDVFLGSGGSGATALAAGATSLVGFEDVRSGRAQAARVALAQGIVSAPRLRRLRYRARADLGGIMRRMRTFSSTSRNVKSVREPVVWLLNGPLRPNTTECLECGHTWKMDCPERCAYSFGLIEAACEGLSGVDLVFFDSDGSAADDWLYEWLTIERVCAPRYVLLVNLSLPHHGGWIRERLLGLGYVEVWADRAVLHPEPYATMAFSDVRRVRSWALLAYNGASAV